MRKSLFTSRTESISTIQRFGWVVGSVILATVVRLALTPLIGHGFPFFTYFIAVVICSLLLGFSAGASTTVLSVIAADVFIINHNGISGLLTFRHFSPCVLFGVAGVTIAAVANTGQKARHSLADNEEHLRLATERSGIGTWRWDVATRTVQSSKRFRELFSVDPEREADFETLSNAIEPADRELMRRSISEAVQNDANFDVEIRVACPDRAIRYLVLRGHGHRDRSGAVSRVDGIAIDISERKNAELTGEIRAKHAGALNVISRSIREMNDPKELQAMAVTAVANALGADRCLVALIDTKKDRLSFVAEWHRYDLKELTGEYTFDDFRVQLNDVFPGSSTLIVDDVENGKSFSAETAEIFLGLQIKSVLAAPMTYEGEIVSALGVGMAHEARRWTSEEVSFIEAAAAQLRSAIESARILNEAQTRAGIESTLGLINDAMRTIADPEAIQESVVSILGPALGADRCYFAIYDLMDGLVTIGNDWHRPDLPSVRGVHNFPNTKTMFSELYPKDPVSIVVDRDTANLSPMTVENMKSLNLRSRLSVAVADKRGMATLTAAMADQPRIWSAADVEVISKVASQLRLTLEMARIRQREHRIASDLQAALIPTNHNAIPGLNIGWCMEPALDEAEIGGDFFDVFPLDGETHAIVIGDVSGKGLAAAAQLAIVRNCIRMALYEDKNPSSAIARVNSILTYHRLLIGFVTAFVGVYDADSGTLSYTSCGH